MNAWRLALGIWLLAASGCGYALEGTRRPEALKDVRNIAIPVFVNETREPGLERTMTDAVRSRFLLDGRLRVVESPEADVVLEAAVREYKLEPIGFSQADQVRRYRVFIRTQVRLRDLQRGRLILDQEIESDSEFDISASIAGSDALRLNTTTTAANSFADELISLVLEGF